MRHWRGCAIAIAVLLGTAATTASANRADLAPYARLVHSSEGPHLLAIARNAMRGYWDTGIAPDSIVTPDWPGPPAGVYVTLTRGRETRACVGSAVPTRGTLPATVRALAIEALRADRRRPPVRREE